MTKIELGMFVGEWRLTRAIDHDDGLCAKARGTVSFLPADHGLRYLEQGTLTTQNGSFSFWRAYRWLPGLEICFDDGRPFHQIPENGACAVHHCAPDTYRVWYDFSHWPHWSSRCRVDGPRKSYQMHSAYDPCVCK